MAFETVDVIEAAVEGENLMYSSTLHHRRMQTVTRGERGMGPEQVLGVENIVLVNGEHIVHDRSQGVECGLDRVSALDGDVPVEYFLEYLRIGDEAAPLGDETVEQSPGVVLVRVIYPD